MKFLNNSGCIFCHDAGAAEFILLIFERLRIKNNITVFLDGPAKKIFARNGLVSEPFSNVEDIDFSNFDFVLTGTSLHASFELDALRIARTQSIRSISILDHWVNYNKRFKLGNESILPDEIWVFDEHSRKIAEGTFGTVKVKLEKNYFMENKRSVYQKIPQKNIKQILYVMENIPNTNSEGERIPFDDLKALELFLKNKEKCDLKCAGVSPVIIKIRLHPSQEKIDLSDLICRFSDFKLICDNEEPLLHEIKKSAYVVGVDTMAMAVSVEVGKKVFCSVPVKPYAQFTNLIPYNELIEKIVDF